MVPQRDWMSWAGYACTMLVAVTMCGSAATKLEAAAATIATFTGRFAYPETTLTPVGWVEAVAVLLYVIPPTAFCGAIMLTGFLGGAIATHVRIGASVTTPLSVAVIMWAGLALRRDVVRRALCGRRD